MTDSFLILVSTILDSLTDAQETSDAVLLKLHALFGPMLTSALQLIDKREVVRVSLPGGRHIWQVTGSTGLPYTIHTHFPSATPHPTSTGDTAQTAPDPDSEFEVETSSPTASSIPSTPLPQLSSVIRKTHNATNTDQAAERERARSEARRTQERERRQRVDRTAGMLESMYCPCAGFLFNSMAGSKNYLCKHLLAVVMAHYTDRAVCTQVRFDGVVDLLGLKNAPAGHGGVLV